MKRIWLLILAAILALAALAFASAEEVEETADIRAADLFELWDSNGESMKWVASAVPVAEGVVVTSPALLPESTEYLVVSDGVNTWEVKALVPDSTGMAAVVFFDPRENPPRFGYWPMLPWGDSVPAGDCSVRYADRMGSRINRGVLASEDIRVKGRRCLLLTLTDPAPPGSVLLTEDGRLAGVVTAEWAEGVSRVLAIPAEELAGTLSVAAGLLGNLPDWTDPPEGLSVTLNRNSATISWKDMALPAKAEGEELYLVVVDAGNSFLSYYPAETPERFINLLLTPGRFYLIGVTASADSPESVPEQYAVCSVPPAKKLTDYGFRPVLTAVAEAPETGLKDGEAPVPVTEVTEELLRSGRAYFYSHSVYEVEQAVEGASLLITLTDPYGVNYRYESSWLYAPEYMAEDIWYLSLKDVGLTGGLDRNGYPRGVYQMAYYVNGDLADSFEFELK